jgi:predicted transcriptional regulator
MNTNEIMDVYDDIKDDLKFITTSSIRTKIILCLKEGDKGLNELKCQLDLKPSPISHALKRLENEDIILKKGKKYSLSSLGKLYVIKSENLFKSLETIKNCEKMWLNHLIDGIPPFLIKKMGCLANSKIVESTPTDVIKPHTYYAELVSRSYNIKAVSPIFYYPFFDLYTTGLKKEAKAEIIVTPLILDAVLKNVGMEKLEKRISSSNLKILRVDEDIKIAFTVTEKFLNFGLFLNDGLYDATMSLVTYDKEAIMWGEELYDYYLKKAKVVNLEDI